MIPIREEDLKDRYRQELQLIEYPESEGNFVIQYHVRGIGIQPDKRIKTKEDGENKRPMIKQLLEEDRWKGAQVRYENGNEFLKELYDMPLASRWEDIEDIRKLGTYKDSDGEEFDLYEIETESTDQWSMLNSSCHLDLRLEMNDHLEGITLLDPGRTGDPAKLSNKKGMNGEKIMTIGKSQQPKEWLTIAGKERGAEYDIEPGDIGATEYSLGKYIVLDFGEWEVGTIKPYYIEFFLHGNHFDGRWNARETSLPPLEPEEKLPEEEQGERLAWLFWKPKDTTPYAVSDRAKEKKWIPPEGQDVLPDKWKEDNEEEYKEWKEWVEKVRKGEGRELNLNLTLPYKLKRVYSNLQDWEEYSLMIKDEHGIRDFKLEENPFECEEIKADRRDKIDNKYWSYQGKVAPNEPYNENKELLTHMETITEGQIHINKTNNGYKLKIPRGRFKNKWELKKHEDNSSSYTIKKID